MGASALRVGLATMASPGCATLAAPAARVIGSSHRTPEIHTVLPAERENRRRKKDRATRHEEEL